MTVNSGLPYYGRKWKILVEKEDGTDSIVVSDSDFDDAVPERGALRCTFNISESLGHCPWYSDVSIWNLRGDTQEKLINDVVEGSVVTVWAGYENGNYGQIFKGQVFQPLFDRQNVTDFILTLHCLVGQNLLHANYAAFTLSKGWDYASLLNKMCQSSVKKIPIKNLTSDLPQNKAPRGIVVMGDPRKTLRTVSKDTSSLWWVDYYGLNVAKLKGGKANNKTITLTPETGLIGTPQQIDDGVTFRCLLNPNMRITTNDDILRVKLDMSVIRQMKITQGMMVSPLDADATYKVVNVVHRGDTRGNDWYTEVIGINEISRRFFYADAQW